MTDILLPPTPPPAPVKPLRIQTLTLRDFRAFAGPAETPIEFGGGNLLVYGENGAGKSSIFHALSGIFARSPDRGVFRREKNVFSGEPDPDAFVRVTFNDGGPPAEWTLARHPGAVSPVDSRVVQTSSRAAMLDYRALLDTNYLHGQARPNLFQVVVDRLLADYPTSGGSTIGQLWALTQSARPAVGYNTAGVDAACVAFNAELHTALAALTPEAEKLLVSLGQSGLDLSGFTFNGVQYANEWLRRERQIVNRELYPELAYRTHGLTHPQLFLNEARSSALALAIYLGGRLACTPTATPGALKLLVLDDVLIGLDLSNRLPLLDVLREHFGDWQVVLLTHDRVWFDMARAHLREAKDWRYSEVLEPAEPDGRTAPIVRSVNERVAVELLIRAERLLAEGYGPAGANYARVAFEQAIRELCDRKGIPVRYRINPKQLTQQEMINALRTWIKDTNRSKGKFNQALSALDLYQQAILNTLSHAGSPDVVKAEVRAAISAVQTLVQSADVVV